jgi:hypothetical protein
VIDEEFVIVDGSVESPLLTAEEAAAYLRCHPKTLGKRGVPYVDLGHRSHFYRKEDLDAWIAQRLKKPLASAPARVDVLALEPVREYLPKRRKRATSRAS